PSNTPGVHAQLADGRQITKQEYESLVNQYQAGLLQLPGPAGSATAGQAQTSWKPPITAGSGQSLLDLDPGYAFRLKEGQKALDRQASAAGGLYSGGQLKAA